MDIKYHLISRKDYRNIKKLIKEAWFGDDYLDQPANLKVYATGYIYMHMSTSSYLIGAYDNDKLIGFLFGSCYKDKIKHRFKNKVKKFLVGFRMLFTKIGRRGLRVYFEEKKIDKSLKKDYPYEDNEICLFIVDEEYRSIGIGSNLQAHYIEYLKGFDCHNFYLFTDTYSNFSFYDKHGYKRYRTQKVTYGNGEESEYYIYLKEI